MDLRVRDMGSEPRVACVGGHLQIIIIIWSGVE